MKRFALGTAVAMLMASPAFAKPHPHLKEAHHHLEEALREINESIKAHEYDKGRMGGHGGEAREKTEEALKEVKAAHEFLESQQ